jgi:hypothetical protein
MNNACEKGKNLARPHGARGRIGENNGNFDFPEMTRCDKAPNYKHTKKQLIFMYAALLPLHF